MVEVGGLGAGGEAAVRAAVDEMGEQRTGGGRGQLALEQPVQVRPGGMVVPPHQLDAPRSAGKHSLTGSAKMGAFTRRNVARLTAGRWPGEAVGGARGRRPGGP